MPDYSNSLTNHTTGNYLKHANFVFSDKHSSPILDLLNPQPGDAIIDLGAGTGQLTEKIKVAVGDSGTVVGIDSSEDMVGRRNEMTMHYSDYVAERSSITLPPTLRNSIFNTTRATSKISRRLTRLSRASLTSFSPLPLFTGAKETLGVSWKP